MVSDYEGNPTIKIVSFHRSLFPFSSDDNIYAAPEKNISSSFDFWSIGVLLYVMLTGKDPFEKKDLSKI